MATASAGGRRSRTSGRALAAALALAAAAGAAAAAGLGARGARADQAAILDAAAARKAAALLAPGMVIVSWAYPRDAPCELAPPDLLRVRDVIVSHGPDGIQVAVLARRLATASSPATPGEGDEEAAPEGEGAGPSGAPGPPCEKAGQEPLEGMAATASAAPAAATASATAKTSTPATSTATATASSSTADPGPALLATLDASTVTALPIRSGWSAAPPCAAERMPLDLAYVYVPLPGHPGRFVNLASQIGLTPEVASLEIAIDPAFLRRVTGE